MRRAEREAAAAAVRVDALPVVPAVPAVGDVLGGRRAFAGRDLRPRRAVPLLQVEVEVGAAGRSGVPSCVPVTVVGVRAVRLDQAAPVPESVPLSFVHARRTPLYVALSETPEYAA